MTTQRRELEALGELAAESPDRALRLTWSLLSSLVSADIPSGDAPPQDRKVCEMDCDVFAQGRVGDLSLCHYHALVVCMDRCKPRSRMLAMREYSATGAKDGDAPPAKAIFSVRAAIAETNLPPDTGSAEAIRELWSLVLFRENEVAVMLGEATRLREELAKGGDAPQEPSPDTDARAQGAAAGVDALLEIIDSRGIMHARAELRADAICNATEGGRLPGAGPEGIDVEANLRGLLAYERGRVRELQDVIAASRHPGDPRPPAPAGLEARVSEVISQVQGPRVPPGGAEPDQAVRDVAEAAAITLRAHLDMGPPEWSAMNTLLDIALGCGESEGGAPSSAPVCCADGCSRPGDWTTPTGRGVCSWCASAFARGCAALEEGAAPPQPTAPENAHVSIGGAVVKPDGHECRDEDIVPVSKDWARCKVCGDDSFPRTDKAAGWSCSVMVNGVETVHTMAPQPEQPTEFHEGKPVEPSGVPDAPVWSLHRLYSVARTRGSTSEGRYGQALFNTLREVRPDIAERLKGPADPFYAAYHDDERLLRAIAVIESMWGGRCTPDADAGTLEALRGAESDLRRIAEMFGDEQGNAVELAAEHAGVRKRVEAVLEQAEEYQRGAGQRVYRHEGEDPLTHKAWVGRHDAAEAFAGWLRAALEVQS